MMFAVPSEHYEVSPTTVHALKQLLILHADHEQNCSTSTVRMVGSSEANLFASIAAGILALWGPLHGGANQEAIEMLQAIQADGGDIDKYVKRAKDPNDHFRLSGFGHRVYKNYDPRPHHQVDGRSRAQGAGPSRRAARHRAAARRGRAHRRVLHRAQAVPERRLLLRPHLPGDGLPGRRCSRCCSRSAACRAGSRTGKRRTRARRRSSGGRARSTPARPSASTPPSTSGIRRISLGTG